MRGRELIEPVKRLRAGECVEVEGEIFEPYRDEDRKDYFDIYAIYKTRQGYFTGYIQFKDCGNRCRLVNHVEQRRPYRLFYSPSAYYVSTSWIIGVAQEHAERWRKDLEWVGR